MIKPEPASWDDLLVELREERFGRWWATGREKFLGPSEPPPRQWPAPSYNTIQQRRRELCEALDGFYIDDVPEPGLAPVIPLRSRRAAA